MKDWVQATKENLEVGSIVKLKNGNQTYKVRNIVGDVAYIRNTKYSNHQDHCYEKCIKFLAVQIEVEIFKPFIPYEPQERDMIILTKQQVFNIDHVSKEFIVGNYKGDVTEYALPVKVFFTTLQNSPVYIIMRDDQIIFSKYLK